MWRIEPLFCSIPRFFEKLCHFLSHFPGFYVVYKKRPENGPIIIMYSKRLGAEKGYVYNGKEQKRILFFLDIQGNADISPGVGNLVCEHRAGQDPDPHKKPGVSDRGAHEGGGAEAAGASHGEGSQFVSGQHGQAGGYQRKRGHPEKPGIYSGQPWMLGSGQRNH